MFESDFLFENQGKLAKIMRKFELISDARQQFHLSVANAHDLTYNKFIMRLLKVGMFSLGLVGGAAATFAGKDCCCCGAGCNKAECHKKGWCSCCCKKYGECDEKCEKGWCKKECKKINPKRDTLIKKDKSPR